MPVTEGGVVYGCSAALEKQACGIAMAGRDLAHVLEAGGTLPTRYTAWGDEYNVLQITGMTADNATDNQTQFNNQLTANRFGNPTLVVLPPAPDFYRYSGPLFTSENTYLVGYGARIKGLTIDKGAIELESNCGVFGYFHDTVNSGYSRWPERFHDNNASEPGKLGDAADAVGGKNFEDAHIHIRGHKLNCVMMDIASYGSLEGPLRCDAENVLIENVHGYRSHSDAFHIIKTSAYVTARRCSITESGDDGFSMIQYEQGNGHPHNILIDECRIHGSRARGFTAVSAKDVLFRRCIADRTMLAPFMVSTTGAHSLTDSERVKIIECQGWRAARRQDTNGGNGIFFSSFTSSGYAVRDLTLRNNRAYYYGDSNPSYLSMVRTNPANGAITFAEQTNNVATLLDSGD